MTSRFVLITAAALMSASAHAADPAKVPVRAGEQPQSTTQAQAVSAQVMLASADDGHGSATPQVPQAPRRARIARVTTCRCGDPQTQPEQ